MRKSKGSAHGQKTTSDLSGLTIGNYKGVMSAWIVITGYHRLGDLNNIRLLLTFLQAWKFEIKVLADSILGEGPFPGLQTATISPCFHMTSLCMCACTERKQALVTFPLLIRALISSWGLHPDDQI